jgi:P27 family predicted phage terminase small subunit
MSKKPPNHLSAPAKRLWADIFTEYAIDDAAGMAILQAALESFDRAQAARKAIKKDGMTITGRDGQVKSHPLLTVERDNRAAFLAGLKALNLDLEPLRDSPGRPGGR